MSQANRLGVPHWESVSQEEWSDWRWQQKNAIRDVTNLNQTLSTFTHFRAGTSPIVDQIAKESFSFRVTPHMVAALKEATDKQIGGAWQAFLKSFIPLEQELPRIEQTNGIDCIGEHLPSANPVPAVTSFYPDRVLFRVTGMCAAYCRYCFRRRMVGDGEAAWNEKEIQNGIAYIASKPNIKEVILSGGDPLVLSDSRLSTLLQTLRRIPHIRRLRIDTKFLTMLPQRFTNDFVNILREIQPFYLIGHFTHLSELSSETRAACRRLADAGIPLRSHTPLLKGVNDDATSLVELMEALVDCRVQPYYLIQFIPTKWTEHFRVPIAAGLDLVRQLQKRCGGLATPTYIVYLPQAGGKVPASAHYLIEHRPEGYLFESQDGRRILYPEPPELHAGAKKSASND